MKSFISILKESVSKTSKLPLTSKEKELIGDLNIFKEKYKLDSTQSNYRFDKNTFSKAFKGKENIDELKKLIGQLK